jgi:hypothetical protein
MKRRRSMTKDRLENRRALHEAMRTRIRLVASERGLPESEIRPVISRLAHEEVARFVTKHRLSYDWLLCGDLQGLLRMERWRRSAG